jgi:ABC-type antimicrobial peptide transport system permease subunit
LVTESVILALLGAGLALRLARLLAAVIWGVSTTNMATFAGVPLVLLAAAGLAIYVPARRALKIDPVAALRNE